MRGKIGLAADFSEHSSLGMHRIERTTHVSSIGDQFQIVCFSGRNLEDHFSNEFLAVCSFLRPSLRYPLSFVSSTFYATFFGPDRVGSCVLSRVDHSPIGLLLGLDVCLIHFSKSVSSLSSFQ